MRSGKYAGPPVSVIVCAYNRYEETMSCLESVRRNTDPDLLAEVVLVDDASTERPLAEFVSSSGVRVVRHHRNTGFLDAANDGASVASGRYLFFLNNDATVTPGWLEPLLERIEQPRVGAVGAKLVYPDGRLQEAGGIIFSDGTGWNLGRGGNKDDLRYNFPREVDYCSGAALMVKRDLFAERGGFDRTFAPGYYEEVDFCFYLRSRGYRVLYEPRSTVIHHEGLTFGSDEQPGSGLHRKTRQYINRYRLVVRWQDALSRQYRPNSNRAASGRAGWTVPSCWSVTTRCPNPTWTRAASGCGGSCAFWSRQAAPPPFIPSGVGETNVIYTDCRGLVSRCRTTAGDRQQLGKVARHVRPRPHVPARHHHEPDGTDHPPLPERFVIVRHRRPALVA